MTTVSTTETYNTVTVISSGATSTVEIISPGPQGPVGPQGPAGADAPDTLVDLTDTNIALPAPGELLAYNGISWVNEQPRVWVYEQATAPSSPNEGDVWINTVFGTTLNYTQNVWVEVGGWSGSYNGWLTEYGYSVPSFSPLDLSPVLWLDASDLSTITEVGGAVSQWDDKSGNGNHVTQATAAAQPTSGATTQNGRNVIDWGNDHMYNNSLSVADPCVVFFVVNRTGTSTQVIYDNNSSDNFNRLISYWQSNSWRYYQGTIVNSGVDSTSFSVFTTVHNQASSLMRLNGSQIISGNPGTQDNATFRLGNDQTGTQPFQSSMGEFIIVSGILTADQIAATETYLAGKWGITL